MSNIKKYSKLTEEVKTRDELQSQLASGSRVKKRFKFTKESFFVVLIVILIAALGTVGYLYINEKKKTENPTQIATEEAQRVKENVGKLILLDENEEPTIATIIDVEALKEENEEFYKNAKNGDKLLLYSQRAILYDPDRNIIVNVAPIIKQPDEEAATPETSTEAESESLTIELRNGSNETGITNNYEDTINEKLGEKYQVLEKTNAANKNYSGIVVYDLTNGTNTLVQNLASELGAEIETTLPSDEADTSADVVVIIGN